MGKKTFFELFLFVFFIAGCMAQEETPVFTLNVDFDFLPVTTSFQQSAEHNVETSAPVPYMVTSVEKIDDQIFENSESSQLKISLKKNEVVILGRDGQESGKISYTMPVLASVSDRDVSQNTIDKINQFFTQEAEDLWNSKDANEVLEKAQAYAQNNNRDDPIFSSEVMTQIIQFNDDVLSIRQIRHWYCGGTVSDLERGMTFDLHTGERLSVEEYIDCTLDVFCTQIVDFLYQAVQEGDLTPISKEELASQYNPSSASINRYEFFLYEGNLYIPLPSAYSAEADKIICWSIEQQMPVNLYRGHMSTNG